MNRSNMPSLTPLVSFVFVLVIVIASCTKEKFESTRTNEREPPGNTVQSYNVCTTPACGASFNANIDHKLTARVQLVSGPKISQVVISILTDTPPYLTAVGSSSGEGITSMTWPGKRGSAYYIKIHTMPYLGQGWMIKMIPNQTYFVTIPGTHIVVAVRISSS